MSIKYKIVIAVFVLLIGGFFLLRKNLYYDIVDQEWQVLNPFKPTQADYNFSALNFEIYYNRGDSINYKYFSKKIVEYHNSHNERQFEKLFSDGNDYWEYKQKKLLIYSKAYEALGETDSSISCLQEGLIHFEKYKQQIDQRFFSLQIKRMGKDQVILELQKGLKNINKLDCFMCNSHFYYFKGYKIGLDINTDNSEHLLDQLIKEYEIE